MMTGGAAEVDGFRVLAELAARRHLEVVGFEAAEISAYVLREIATTVDEMLTKYPIALRGIESVDASTGRARRRTGPTAIWIILDAAALARSALSVDPPPRRLRWKSRDVERPVYVAVVREFAGALDAAGGFRARQEAQRRLVTESLRGRRLEFGPLDPAEALLAAFAEVETRGRRAGKSARMLHEVLVTMAGVEPVELGV